MHYIKGMKKQREAIKTTETTGTGEAGDKGKEREAYLRFKTDQQNLEGHLLQIL